MVQGDIGLPGQLQFAISMSCDRHYGIVNYDLVCSGHGDCIDNKCYCHPGWTGQANLEVNIHFDCDINIVALQVMYGIALALAVFGTILISRNLLRHPINTWSKLKQTRNVTRLAFFGSLLNIILFTLCRIIDPVNSVSGMVNPGAILNATGLIMFNVALFCGMGA